ncbi:MAG: sialidase family protein [Bacteroides sp.]
MNKYLLCVLFILNNFASYAAGEVVAKVYDAELPVLINKKDNILCEIIIESPQGGEMLNELTFAQQGLNVTTNAFTRIFYSGTSSVMRSRTPSQAIYAGVKDAGGSQLFYCHPSYSILKKEQKGLSTVNRLSIQTKLVKGLNYFWISLQLDPATSLNDSFTIGIKNVKINNIEVKLLPLKNKRVTHRIGYALRQAGDDNVHSYRIPGLVTTNTGTLLGVYDVRHQTNIDLQEDIDIGLSRSEDHGKSWEPMKIIIDMGEYNGLPQAQNGIGDPAILVDQVTNQIWVSAVWVHGLSNARAWGSVRSGMSPEDGTGQLILVKSSDDGRTWSKPINLTSQVKSEDITMLLQGPGRGITMQDGTLVFAVQYKSIKNKEKGEVAIITSIDRGITWQRSNSIPTEELISEPQVAEITPGCLMINARTSAPCRFVAFTNNLGKSWKQHTTSGTALTDPGCMGSLLSVSKANNVLNKNILLFSNPNNTAERPAMSGRKNITIKASLDSGKTWPKSYQINLDEEQGWGYSCLTLIDNETIGILYEGSTAQMVFQRIKLQELIKKHP